MCGIQRDPGEKSIALIRSHFWPQGMGKGTPETHLLRFLSHLRRRDDSGVGSVLGAPHKLRLGQLLSAVLLHSLSLELGNASVLGPEDLGGVGLFSHLGGGGLLLLPGVSLCGEKEAEVRDSETRTGRIGVRGVREAQREPMRS